MGLFTGDAVSQVTLASPGANASAAAGNYLIVPSAASGLGLGNYLISYRTGILKVQGTAKPQPVTDNTNKQPTIVTTVSVTPPVLAAQVSSTAPVQELKPNTVQTASTSTLPLLPQDVQRSNSLSGLSSLDIINRGIRLPEGI
ncbi:hypothetical protein J2W58_004959 [Pseudomonas psychrotolerans]|nr:hypothetical protein [Pseudomonas psychrotolerans]